MHIQVALFGVLSLTLLAETAAVGKAFGTGPQKRYTVCGSPETVTVVSTVHDDTNTVTIILEDTSQIAASVSSRASSDEVSASISRDLTPINPTATTTTDPTTTADQFTYTETVQVVEATKPQSGSVYYYVTKSGTTSWLDGQTPIRTASAVVGTTTVVVSPLPYVSPTESTDSTTQISKTLQSSVTSNLQWSSTYGWSNSSTFPSESSIGAGPGSERHLTSTLVIGYSTTSIGSAPVPTTILEAVTSQSSISKRQVGATVTWISNGITMTWINSWDGTTNVDLSSWFSAHPRTTSSLTSSFTTVPTVTITLSPSRTTVTTSVVSVTKSSTTSATPAPTNCGTEGEWVLGFDDLPTFSPPNNDTAPFPPIFNPHDLLFFSDCWSYVPPPTEPFPPQNGSHLAECTNTTSGDGQDDHSPDEGLLQDGSFGAGPRAGVDAYWLNVRSAYVGCNNSDASVNCNFTARGYQWQNATDLEKESTSFTVSVPGCQGFKGCHLQYVDFGDAFTGVSSVGFTATVKGAVVNWFVDTIALEWWNNTCAAGLVRAKNHF